MAISPVGVVAVSAGRGNDDYILGRDITVCIGEAKKAQELEDFVGGRELGGRFR
ncbi:hypothetical protein RUND412_005526, partial [Rhizina undulata]